MNIIQENYTKKVIYVDIGHNVKGDNGSGDPSTGLSENDCTTQIGTALIDILNNWGYDARPAFTQEDKERIEQITDTNVALNESLKVRTKRANENNADLYISIHLNANPEGVAEDEKGRGTAIYVKTLQERNLANSILKQICNQHYDLGADEFSDGDKLLGKPFRNGGVEDGSELYVLRTANCPAILIECCYVDNAIDVGLYKDKKPYINHERTILEEGVEYVNENVFSYNFFAYCIARGISDYYDSSTIKPIEFTDVDDSLLEQSNLNYMCYIDEKEYAKLSAIINKNGFVENLYSNRILSLLETYKTNGGATKTLAFLAYRNYNSIQANYATIVHEEFYKGLFKNIANLGTKRTINGKKALVFSLKEGCNVYRSDGSAYATLSAGDMVGVYLSYTQDGPNYNPVIYETYDGIKGPIVCAPTRPNWMKINFAIRLGKHEALFNEYGSEDYAWLETNLDRAIDISDFVLSLYK